MADVHGNVTQTLIFKDQLTSKDFSSVPLLNPSKYPMTWVPLSFGLLYGFGDDRVITCSDNVAYIINLKTVRIEKSINHLRR